MPSAAFWRAWSIWAVCLLVTFTALAYTALHPLPPSVAANFGGTGAGVVGIVFILTFATVGAILAWKRPQNPIGWLLSATCLSYGTAGFGTLLAHFPRALSVADWLGFLYLLGLGLCVFVVLLFPRGTCPPAAGGRWPGWPGQAWLGGRSATRSRRQS